MHFVIKTCCGLLMYCAVAGCVVVLTGRCAVCQELPSPVVGCGCTVQLLDVWLYWLVAMLRVRNCRHLLWVVGVLCSCWMCGCTDWSLCCVSGIALTCCGLLVYCAVAGCVVVLTGCCAACQELPSPVVGCWCTMQLLDVWLYWLVAVLRVRNCRHEFQNESQGTRSRCTSAVRTV